jgi:DNA-binding Lrp family transcriptional regulator
MCAAEPPPLVAILDTSALRSDTVDLDCSLSTLSSVTTMVLDTFDDVDRQLLHALQIDGRAPFRRIGEVLGVSDQTVARRYARLRSSNALRVLGLVDPTTVGDVVWSVRVRCAPDTAPDIADALARRSDTSWISLAAGGGEILGSLRVAVAAEAEALAALPRTPGVLEVTAQQVLHTFFGGADSLVTKTGVLDEDQVARLSAHLPAPTGPATVDDTDRRLLGMLRRDGRAPVEDLARHVGASASTVRRRLSDLRAGGMLFFDVDFDHGMLDARARTMLWLTVAPAELDAVGRALAGHPEVPYAAAVTGRSNLHASVSTPSPAAFYRYLTTRIAALPGVVATETVPVRRTVKAAGTHYARR